VFSLTLLKWRSDTSYLCGNGLTLLHTLLWFSSTD